METRRTTLGFLRALLLILGGGALGWFGAKNAHQPRVNPYPDLSFSPSADIATSEPKVHPNLFSYAFGALKEAPSLEGALLAFCVLDSNGKTVFSSPLGETSLCPASALKTLTTGAAFEMLGADFRFTTTLNITSPIDATGKLEGDLVLVGSGDPTLSTGDLEKMADALVEAGLKRLHGSIRVDAGIFKAEPMSDHWNWGDIGNAYGAGAYGVNVDHNCSFLTFSAGAKPGDAVVFQGSTPRLEHIDWSIRAVTGATNSGDGLVVYSEPFGNRIDVRGTIPLGEKSFTTKAAIPNPPALARLILKARLEAKGVVLIEDPEKEASGPDAASLTLASHSSRPLAEIIDHLHRVSDNLESQCLFLTLGNLKKSDPKITLRTFWEKAGVSFRALRIEDGSGLARAAMIRPIDLAMANHLARRAPTGPRFYQSLSSSAEGRIRSKVGAMSGVRTEVGFLTRPDGSEYTFALMANGLPPHVDFWALRNELLGKLVAPGH